MNSNNNKNKDNKEKNEWNKKYTLIAVYTFIVIVASFAVILVILAVRDFFLHKQYAGFLKILTPAIYGFIFAYLLNPLLMFFQNKVYFKMRGKAKNVLSILSTYLVLGIVITLILLMVIPQVIESIQQLTGKATDLLSFSEGDILNSKIGVYIRDLGDNIQNYINGTGLNIHVDEMLDGMLVNITNLVTMYITPALNSMATVLFGVGAGVWNVILGLLMSVYLLISKDKFIAQTKKLLFAVFPAKFSYRLVQIVRKTHEVFGGFITGKIIESLIVGVICFIGMSVLQLHYTPLITAIVTVTNVIPFFGSIIGGVIGVFFLAINDMGEAVRFGIFILVLQQVDGNFIGPKILGSKTGLPAFWVIFSIILMSGLFGLPGFFFGVPVFAVIYILIKEYAEGRLESKGYPVETKEYVRHRGSVILEDGEKKKSGNKKHDSKPIFYRKALHNIAGNIMNRFGWGKNKKDTADETQKEPENKIKTETAGLDLEDEDIIDLIILKEKEKDNGNEGENENNDDGGD